jgi:hypothetical protein
VREYKAAPLAAKSEPPVLKPAPSAGKPAPSAGNPAPSKRRPFEGWGTAFGNGLASATGALVRVTGKVFGGVRDTAGASVAEFRARAEHSRWRVYALGSFGIVVAATFLGQLYTDNALGAYVRVQPVALPAMTQIFVRNDSRRVWNNVKLTLNGIYSYEQTQVQPGLFIMLPVNRFALSNGNGKATYAPKNIVPKLLTIDTSDQHFETELKE